MNIFKRKKKQNTEPPSPPPVQAAPPPPPVHFYLEGTSGENPDGTERQEVLRKIADVARAGTFYSPYSGVSDRTLFEKGGRAWEIADLACKTSMMMDDEHNQLISLSANLTVLDGRPAVTIESEFGTVGVVPEKFRPLVEEHVKNAFFPTVDGILVGGRYKYYDPDAGTILEAERDYQMVIEIE